MPTHAPIPAAKGKKVWAEGTAGRLLSDGWRLVQDTNTERRMMPCAGDGKGLWHRKDGGWDSSLLLEGPEMSRPQIGMLSRQKGNLESYEKDETAGNIINMFLSVLSFLHCYSISPFWLICISDLLQDRQDPESS